MAKRQKTSAYGILVRILIVLFVLALICGGGYVLMDQSIKAQEEENAARAEEQNRKLEEDYQQALQEEAAQAAIEAEEAAQWPAPTKQSGWEIVDLTGYSVKNATQVTVSRQDLLTGGMMLLNHWHSQPDDFPVSEVAAVYSTTKNIPVSGSSVRLFPNAIAALEKLLLAAKDAGYEGYVINEGFRESSQQWEYYEKEAQKYENTLFGDALVEKVRQTVNYPGTSEYQSGFSFMVDRYLKDSPIMDSKFQDLEMSDWLLEHSWEYGIIFRFPVQGYPNNTVTDKSYKTGETKKLSIYRYVGEANAAVMHIMNFCMEEYIEYLMAHPHIAVYKDGVLRYEITRIDIGSNTGSVTVEINRQCMGSYTASIDNTGGVIVAMSY